MKDKKCGFNGCGIVQRTGLPTSYSSRADEFSIRSEDIFHKLVAGIFSVIVKDFEKVVNKFLYRFWNRRFWPGGVCDMRHEYGFTLGSTFYD